MATATSPEYITIQEWCERMFGFIPKPNTLRRYKKNNQIQPPPVRFGNKTMCHRDAKFYGVSQVSIKSDNPLVERIFHHGR